MSDSPSFGCSVTGSSPALRNMAVGAASLVAASQFALANQRQREVRQRSEIAARADASLLRHPWMEARVQHLGQQLGQFRPRAGVALGDDIGAQQHHRADFALRHRIADAGGVTANEVALQLGQPRRRNRDVRQLAEAGRHAIDDGAVGDEAVDHPSSPRGALARRAGESDGSKVARDGDHVFDPQRIAVEDDFVWHAGMSAATPVIQD